MADHALATVSNPSSALTDFTLIVDLADMPASWWTAVDTTDGTRGRVYKGDGTTRLACDWIDFDDTAETGILRVLWSGSLASSGTQQLWIEPPVAANAAVAADNTYGSDNAYNSSWKAYWPMNGTADRTLNGNDLTAVGGVSFGNASGKLGLGTDFEPDDNQSATAGTGSSLELANHTLLAWVKPESFPAGGRKILFAKSDSILVTGYEFGFTQATGYPSFAYNNGAIRGWYDGAAAFSTGSFQHIAYDVSFSGGTITFYKNASAGSAVSINAANPVFDGDTATIAWQSDNPYEFDGIINELQLHSAIRGADWIAQEYDQTNDNADFWGTWTWTTAGAFLPIFKRLTNTLLRR